MLKKPSEELLEYIDTMYIYHPETGEIDGPNFQNVGYAEKSQSRVFIRIDIKGKHYKRAHLAWFLYYKVWPTQQIDHENRNSCDDRIENLREVDDFTQQQNKDVYKGYRGFSIAKKLDGKWRKRNLTIRNQTKGIFIGYALDREEAKKIIDEYWNRVGKAGG